MNDDPIPPSSLPLVARAPGKCVIFGEHAVVHGRPELVLAIDLPVQVGVRVGERTILNGDPDAATTHPYLRTALEKFWSSGPPIVVRAQSRVPRSAGLGSSAAFSSALAAALSAARGGVSRTDLAQRAFEIERDAQGVGSPGDTAASVGGGYLSLNGPGGEEVFRYAQGDRGWTARRVRDPSWSWVVAYSGVPRSTADAVRKVGERLAAPDGPALLDDLERIARDGIAAVEAEDRTGVGALLDENHAALVRLGISHPRLEALIEAARPSIVGGKLTGAGAGGSVVVLPVAGRELDAARRIARAGGLPFVVRAEPRGASLVDDPTVAPPDPTAL